VQQTVFFNPVFVTLTAISVLRRKMIFFLELASCLRLPWLGTEEDVHFEEREVPPSVMVTVTLRETLEEPFFSQG